ncbi:MAG: HD domain-containing phosphohydrolase [Amphritea sp.]
MTADQGTYIELEKRSRALSTALDYRDQATHAHSHRVQTLSEALGKEAGLSEAELAAIRVSAVFHDIGKIGIPDHILLKPSALNAVEWVLMRQHPIFGERIILSTELKGASQAAKIIRHHHEQYDGSGYPDSLKGDDIPLGARIIGIADSYDAMSHTRAYHEPKSHRDIMEILERETGYKHNPEIMKLFTHMIKSSPYRVN